MSGNSSKILAATKELANQWLYTREYWRDAKSQEFDRRYMQELVASVDRALTVIEQLDKLFTKIRHDCE
jgi:hypothetical protein